MAKAEHKRQEEHFLLAFPNVKSTERLDIALESVDEALNCINLIEKKLMIYMLQGKHAEVLASYQLPLMTSFPWVKQWLLDEGEYTVTKDNRKFLCRRQKVASKNDDH